MDRIDLYLQSLNNERYENTKKENTMVEKVSTLFSMAKVIKKV